MNMNFSAEKEKKVKTVIKILFGFLVGSMLSAGSLQAATKQQKIDTIALQAYIYTYPLVLMDVTRKQMTNTKAGVVQSRGPMMHFTHLRAFPPAGFKEVVRPNFDTLYSLCWLDLTKEPAIIETPQVKERFYMLPLLDMWSDVFGVIGTYADGNEPQAYAICPQGWSGTLPEGVKRIDSPTPYVWLLGRIQTNGVKDYSYIHKIQNGLKATPLSYYVNGKKFVAPFKKDSSVDDTTPPLKQIKNMSAKEYFTYAMGLMELHPPHITDSVITARMREIGLDYKNFDYDKLPENIKTSLAKAVKASHPTMLKYVPKLGDNVNGWTVITKSIGVYGNDYLQRATIALIGLGANPYEQAIYPLNQTDRNGKVPMGGKKYILHFSKDEIPPVDAFWSLTMYDEEGFHIDNKINRFAIGDRDGLKYNKDGSLDIYIQPVPPGKEKESNWLPSPASGKLGMTLRLYAPRQSVLDGTWKPPYIEEVK
jgi:hypothetical protein